MTAEGLIDDLLALDKAGLETGFKPRAIREMKTENRKGLKALESVALKLGERPHWLESKE